MALTKVFQLYGVKCGSTVLHQLQDATLSRNVMEQLETPVGGVMPLFVAEMGQKPDVSFTSHQLKSLITLMGIDGADTGIVKLLGRKTANKTGPVAVGTGEHASWTAAASMGHIASISAGNRQRANAQCKINILKDGTTTTIVYSGTATVDAVTAAAEQFILGPIVIDGTVIEGTNDLSINFNPQIIESDDDYAYDPVFAAVQKTEPTIEFSTTDPGIWALDGTEFDSGGPVKVNLIALNNNGQRELDATTAHILFESNFGQIRCQSIGGTKQMTRVFIRCLSADNTVLPLTATVDNAVEAS